MPDPDNTTPTPEVVRETIQAPYRFTNDERLKLGEDLVTSMQNLDHIERELDSVKQDFKARVERAELEIGCFRRKLSDGFEMRPTGAIVEFNVPSQGRKQYRNETSGEIIRDEFMTPADFERPLFRTPDGHDETVPGEAAPEAGQPERNRMLLDIVLDQPGWTAGGLRTEFQNSGTDLCPSWRFCHEGLKERHVEPGLRFWLYLRPGSITSLRHAWLHPSFDTFPEPPAAVQSENEASEKYVRKVADSVGLSYQALLNAAERHLLDGEYLTGGSEMEGMVTPKDFWVHYANVTGVRISPEQQTNFFSCSC